ncbi:HlyD family efflux transporter periplasmic adaptor subunit [Actinoplanes sp. NPDC049548]|uniref:HlyD family efflux transporter periplasmic adaptor subunit n=1 Tax=Actinoplanes sp. NPDC049548 TaxID=3155152 RepID=UPI00341F74FC
MVQPTGTSSQDSADPIEAPRVPPPPPPGKTRARVRKWRARFIVLVLLAAAVALFLRISSARATDAARIDLGTVTLTAQPIPVEVAQVGQVTAVAVTAQQQVAAKQKLGTIAVATTDSDGDPKTTKVDVTAPSAGIVVDLPVTVGSTIGPGQPFVRLYDPAQVRFETKIPLEDLPDIAPKMQAVLETDGINRKIHAVVQRVVPRVGDPVTTVADNPRAMTLVLVPATADDVRGLVPGLRFTGYVDTTTGVPGTARLVSLGRI